MSNLREYISRFTFYSVGNFWFLLQGVLAVVFFMERSATYDSAHYLVHLVEKGGFHIEHGRYGAFITQLLPVLCVKIGLSLQIVALAWSLNYILVYGLLWRFIVGVCKNREAAIAFFLFSGLAVRFLYYWPVSEMQQCLFWCIALWAWLGTHREFSQGLRHSVTFLLSLQCALSYPLFPLFAAFIIAERVCSAAKFSVEDLKANAIPAAVIIVGILARMLLFPQYIHENRLENFQQVQNVFPRIWELPGAEYFWHVAWHWYPAMLYMFALGLVMNLLRKKWFWTIAASASALAYVVLMLGGYPDGESSLISENLFQPVSFFAVILVAVPLSRIHFALPFRVNAGALLHPSAFTFSARKCCRSLFISHNGFSSIKHSPKTWNIHPKENGCSIKETFRRICSSAREPSARNLFSGQR